MTKQLKECQDIKILAEGTWSISTCKESQFCSPWGNILLHYSFEPFGLTLLPICLTSIYKVHGFIACS